MSGSSSWESVYDTTYDKMDRQAVDGGWLYRNRFANAASPLLEARHGWQVTVTFVPTAQAPLGQQSKQ